MSIDYPKKTKQCCTRDWLKNWKLVIAGLKLPPIDTAATVPPPGEAVADPENAPSGHEPRSMARWVRSLV